MRYVLFFCLLLTMPLLAKPHVLVSIAPQKYLVSRLAGDRLAVDVIVPNGSSPHTYEPTPKQTLTCQKSCIWFRIGEGFEQRLVTMLGATLHVVDQREGLALLPACGCCHHMMSDDPHVWLSPPLLKQLATQMADVLCVHFPESASFFRTQLTELHSELDALDNTLRTLLKDRWGETILVTHPAFGYFYHEYGLHQLSIEQEGKEPSPKQLMDTIAQAQAAHVKLVVLQRQYNTKGGDRIAHFLGARVWMMDPYREDVIDNLREFAHIL